MRRSAAVGKEISSVRPGPIDQIQLGESLMAAGRTDHVGGVCVPRCPTLMSDGIEPPCMDDTLDDLPIHAGHEPRRLRLYEPPGRFEDAKVRVYATQAMVVPRCTVVADHDTEVPPRRCDHERHWHLESRRTRAPMAVKATQPLQQHIART